MISLKNQTHRFLGLGLAAIALFLAPSVKAATVTYNADESSTQGPDGSALAFARTDGSTDLKYGSSGYILYAASSTCGTTENKVSGKDPLTFNQGGFATINTLPAALFAAKSLKQDVTLASGFAGGARPGKSNETMYFGAVGTETAGVNKAEMLSLTFKQASASGYRIAILGRPLTPNGNAVSGITLSSGSSSASAKPFDEMNQSTVDAVAFYSFDVTNIKAGDVVTLTLSEPTSESNLVYLGLTVDELSSSGTAGKSATPTSSRKP